MKLSTDRPAIGGIAFFCCNARTRGSCSVATQIALGRVVGLRPTAIVLTHAHPDHASGLADGAPCPVYATAVTWARINRYPIAERRVIEVGQRFCLGSVAWEAYDQEFCPSPCRGLSPEDWRGSAVLRP